MNVLAPTARSGHSVLLWCGRASCATVTSALLAPLLWSGYTSVSAVQRFLCLSGRGVAV